ncbi:MAG: retroviral-like aspartic protease family protein [Zoogloeaceae bacterium]|nr:retroviral-like aspartic protease family protein [Zoogloeaceae bacterium]
MKDTSQRGWGRYCRALALALSLGIGVLALPAWATNVGLAGIIGSKAMLMINGSTPRALSVGQEYQGVRLISIQGESVQVEVNGNRRTLKIGQNAVGAESSGADARAVLIADGQGHFQANGAINGRSVRFLVDTGASTVSMGASEAQRLGLDLEHADRGLSNTANGTVITYRLRLNSVKVGDITLSNVEASVLPQNMPFVLLGMSFLNRTRMERNGDTMTLTQSY